MARTLSAISLLSLVVVAAKITEIADDLLPLHMAVVANDVAAIKELVGKPSFDIEATDDEGNTALHIAALKGHADSIAALCAAGASASARASKNATALHVAAYGDRVAACEALLNACGATLEAQDEQDKTPLHYAVGNNRLPATKALLQAGRKAGSAALFSSLDHSKWTALHIAAAAGYVEIVNEFIRVKAPLDIPGNNKETALHLAVREGHIKTVRVLVEAGASIHAQTSNQYTPLQLAKVKQRTQVFGYLKDAVENQQQRLKEGLKAAAAANRMAGGKGEL